MAKLTKKQKDFADKYLETGNGTKAALEVYDTDDNNTAGVIGYENLRKPKIIAYTEEHVATAKSLLYELMNDKSVKPETRAQIASSLIDRIEGKAVQRNINANAETEKEYKWAE